MWTNKIDFSIVHIQSLFLTDFKRDKFIKFCSICTQIVALLTTKYFSDWSGVCGSRYLTCKVDNLYPEYIWHTHSAWDYLDHVESLNHRDHSWLSQNENLSYLARTHDRGDVFCGCSLQCDICFGCLTGSLAKVVTQCTSSEGFQINSVFSACNCFRWQFQQWSWHLQTYTVLCLPR